MKVKSALAIIAVVLLALILRRPVREFVDGFLGKPVVIDFRELERRDRK